MEFIAVERFESDHRRGGQALEHTFEIVDHRRMVRWLPCHDEDIDFTLWEIIRQTHDDLVIRADGRDGLVSLHEQYATRRG